MKLFSFERFLKAIHKISPKPAPVQIHQLASISGASREFAFFNMNKKMVRVLLSDILFVESMREYVSINTGSEKVITKMKIAEIEQILLPPAFVRIQPLQFTRS